MIWRHNVFFLCYFVYLRKNTRNYSVSGIKQPSSVQFFICFEFYNSSAEHNNINNTTELYKIHMQNNGGCGLYMIMDK